MLKVSGDPVDAPEAMLQTVLALALALSFPSAPVGDGAAAAAMPLRPWRALTANALARALPSETTSSHALLRRPGGESIALVSRRAIVGPIRTVESREVLFAGDGLRILLTEERTGALRRLVWRELRPHGARTWTAAWGPGGGRVTGYGWRRPVHEALSGLEGDSAEVLGPLELERLLSEGKLVEGARVRVVDPAAARVITASIRDLARGMEARRADGTLLIAVEDGLPRFHDGAGAALPIPEDAAARHRQRWLVESVPAHEFVLARIRASR